MRRSAGKVQSLADLLTFVTILYVSLMCILQTTSNCNCLKVTYKCLMTDYASVGVELEPWRHMVVGDCIMRRNTKWTTR